jgi:hypothetical protein
MVSLCDLPEWSLDMASLFVHAQVARRRPFAEHRRVMTQKPMPKTPTLAGRFTQLLRSARLMRGMCHIRFENVTCVCCGVVLCCAIARSIRSRSRYRSSHGTDRESCICSYRDHIQVAISFIGQIWFRHARWGCRSNAASWRKGP